MTLPFDDAVAIVADDTELSELAVRNKVASLVDKYNGLLDEDAAVILLGNKHGTDILRREKYEHGKDLPLTVDNIEPEMTDCNIEVTVDTIQSVNEFDGGKVRNVLVKDLTAKTQITFWNEDVDEADKFSEGQTIKLFGAYTRPSDYLESRYGVPAEIRVGKRTWIVDKETGETILDNRDDS